MSSLNNARFVAYVLVFVGISIAVSVNALPALDNRERIVQKPQPIYGWSTEEFNGHSYVMRRGYNGVGIVHDPDCPCQRAGKGGADDR